MSGVPVPVPLPPYQFTKPPTSLGSPPVTAPNNAKGGSSKRPAPRGSAAYPRKRANKACQVCRARRTKCDNKRPTCSFCERTGAICNWSPDDLSSFDPASLAILERLDRLESLLVSGDTHPAQPILQGPVSPESYNVPQSFPQTAVSPESYIIPSYQHETPQDRLGCVSIGLIDVRLDAVLEWQPLKDQLASFRPLVQVYEPLQCLPSQGVTTPGELEMSSCNEMLACFWTSVHSKNPILVQEDIRGYMHEVCMNGIGWDARSCLVLLICALGTIASEFGSNKDNEDQQLANEQITHRLARAEHYFAASQKRIGVCLGKRGLIEAQCFFYSGVYLATTMQPEAAWSLFLQATASCQDFRCLSRMVPRDEDRGPNIETEDKWIAEECTYWTCLKSELEIHLEISPPGFRTIDLWYPEKFPDPPRNITTDVDRSWFFYLAEIALRRLANRVMGYISQDYDLDNPKEQRCAQETAVRFEGQAQDWIQSLPSPNELEQNSVDKDVLNFILKGHLANCHELIYWPFIKHALQFPQIASDPNPNDDYIQKGLHLCVHRIELNQPGFRHRHHGTWGMVRACTRSAFVLLAASHYPPLRGLMPEGWERAVWNNVQLLEFWSREIKGAKLWREMMIFLLPNSQPS